MGVRRALIVACACVWLPACGDGADAPEPACENLLLVVVDTLRADHVGALGYARETTPHLDAFADTGAVFRQAVAPSSWTRPSMAALMTGVLPSTTGLTCHNFRFPSGDCDVLRPGMVTLAELLGERGFRTFGVVANINVDPVFGFDQGFAEYVSIPEKLQGDEPQWRMQNGWLSGTTQAVTDEALAWLGARKGEEPFFLYLHYLDPHEPYAPPQAEQVFDASSYGVPPAARESAALYDGEIRLVDRELQRVFARLEADGLAASTAVVVVSDHGEEFLDHGGTHHGFTLYDEQLLVPLILRIPGWTRAGTVVEEQVSLLDVVPTVLEALALSVPDWVQGRSLLARLVGEPLDDRPVVSEWGYRPLSSLRAPPWKLIHDHDTGVSELYRIADDPGEQRDVAASHPDVAAELLRILIAAREEAAAAADRFARGGEGVQLTDEQIRQLEALGYTGDE